MKNKRAQIGPQLGIVLITFVAILVGVILFQVVAQQAGEGTSLITITNQTLTAPTNGTYTYMTDIRSISDVIITNASGLVGLVVVGPLNYTIENNQIHPTTGDLTVRITPTATYPEWSGEDWNISGTAQPLTYINDSGARAMTNLIAIFFALAVAVVALIPTLRSQFLELIGR